MEFLPTLLSYMTSTLLRMAEIGYEETLSRLTGFILAKHRSLQRFRNQLASEEAMLELSAFRSFIFDDDASSDDGWVTCSFEKTFF
tara:strand:- start:3856 stop:4113 length:258 start_codon:yes stop_codon:yes gene_type:complete